MDKTGRKLTSENIIEGIQSIGLSSRELDKINPVK
jgi:hypothetical protein